MITEFYYDTFEKECVLEKDSFSPPERYVLMLRGDKDDYYIDHYIAKNSRGFEFPLDIVYPSPSIPGDYRESDAIKTKKFKEYDCVPIAMPSVTVPPNNFDMFLKNMDW